MKKSIYYMVLTGLLFVLGLVSCNNTSEEVFDQPSSERLTNMIKEYKTALLSADKGWLLEYFPDNKQQYGGYNYSVKFNKNLDVTVLSEVYQGGTASESSSYDVIAYGGPVLSFNTYNKALMEAFSKPSSEEYNAKGGDYEFLLMANEADTIHLKGIKTTNNMRLIKLTEPFSTYLGKTKKIQTFLKTASLGATVNNKNVDVLLNGRNLTFKYEEEKKIKSTKIAFIYTDKGIRLYKPIEIGKVSAQEFILDKEAKTLNSTSGQMKIDIAFVAYNYAQKWYASVDQNKVSQSFITMFSAFQEEYKKTPLATKYGLTLSNKIYLGASLSDNPKTGISFVISPYSAVHHLVFKAIVGKSNQVDIIKDEAGSNWSFFGNSTSIIMDKLLGNSPYNLELDKEKNPTTVKYISTKDANFWFILKK